MTDSLNLTVTTVTVALLVKTKCQTKDLVVLKHPCHWKQESRPCERSQGRSVRYHGERGARAGEWRRVGQEHRLAWNFICLVPFLPP